MVHDFDKNPELTNSQMNFYYFSSPHKQILEGFLGEVVKVHDGDTVTLRTDFRDFDFPLRMANIQAPELNTGDKRSQEWLEQQVLGQEVYIKMNKNNRVGKYGRLIGEIILGGVNINNEIMREGLAVPFGSFTI